MTITLNMSEEKEEPFDCTFLDEVAGYARKTLELV
jgi:hypothetical protein